MSYAVRSREILDYMKKKKSASVEELARALFVSGATIRRDLIELQKTGLVERTHGGAVLIEDSSEISIFIRRAKNIREKLIATEIALRHLPDFSIVFIDNSSTCLALVEKMNFTHKTIVTNGLQIALCVAQKEGENLLILPGGEVAGNTTAVAGAMTVNALHDFRFDLALLSCSAVDADGSYELSPEAMQIKKVAIERSRTKVLIFDHTKCDTHAPYHTAPLDAYNMIVCDARDGTPAFLKGTTAKIYIK